MAVLGKFYNQYKRGKLTPKQVAAANEEIVLNEVKQAVAKIKAEQEAETPAASE